MKRKVEFIKGKGFLVTVIDNHELKIFDGDISLCPESPVK